jgi:hypothetical protein
MMVKGTTIQPHSDLEAEATTNCQRFISAPTQSDLFMMLGRNIWLLEFKLGA